MEHHTTDAMLRACEQARDGDGEVLRKEEKEEEAEEKQEDETQSPHTQRRKAGMLAVLALRCAQRRHGIRQNA